MITLDKLFKINKKQNLKECEYYIDALNRVLPEYKINTPVRIAHFLAQIIYESEYLKRKEENLNYSETRLLDIFGKYFNRVAVKFQYFSAQFFRFVFR